jgi:hypothetical protein
MITWLHIFAPAVRQNTMVMEAGGKGACSLHRQEAERTVSGRGQGKLYSSRMCLKWPTASNQVGSFATS